MTFQATSYQKRGIEKMMHGHAYLAWDPGTGKTYPALIAGQFLDGPQLIVCPAHLREQWKDQAKQHVPLRRATILTGLKDKISDRTFASNDIFICSYNYVSELLRWKQLRLRKWTSLVLDEAHYLSALGANRTRAVLGLKTETKNGLVYAADCVWFLTGTPFTFPHQIYPILSRLWPDAIKRLVQDGAGQMSMKEWINRFCDSYPAPGGYGDKITGAKNIPELRARLEPVLDKVKLSEAVDLPPMIIDHIHIHGTLPSLTKELPPEVLEAYDALYATLQDPRIPDDDKLAALEGAGVMMAQLRHSIAVAKISPTKEIIQGEIDGGLKKLLVLGWHRRPLQVLAQDLRAPLIYGGISSTQKYAAISKFLTDPTCHVLLGQISSIGTGTDGLQEVCSRSLFLESSWAYRENKQALHRTYRKGQRNPCHASFITLKGSVDEYVNHVLARNAETVRKALD